MRKRETFINIKCSATWGKFQKGNPEKICQLQEVFAKNLFTASVKHDI